ncbi:MAG: carboxypeptidase regulatory-like domain-containing protein [Bacteroidetes bacterium]|nr:carboxypeptidase regulatory-like domain-containing protein [Bacteroidota bacterium]
MKKLLTLLLTILLMSGAVVAEKPSVKMGDIYYKQFDYRNAIEFYKRALKKDSSNVYVLQRIADSHRLINDWAGAEPYYARLSQMETADLTSKLYYAEALRANQKYAEAKEQYKAYSELAPNDLSVKERMDGIDKIEELSKDNGLYELKNLKQNSKYSDFGVAFFKDTGIFFCSNRYEDAYVKFKDDWTKGSFLQIYQAFKTDSNSSELGPAQLMRGKLPNKKFHEGSSSYNEKMGELFFDRSNYNGKRAFFSADKTVKLKLYRISWLKDKDSWGAETVEAVSFNDKEYSVGHPSLSKDAKTLYFASDKPGGYGGVDIYISTREIGGPWTTPLNLGPKINTSGDEMFPFVSEDGTLYFASTGHTGLGGLDIYSASMIKTGGKTMSWTEPQNLGYPVNTNADDFNYIINRDNKQGYLSSNRPGGQGDDDIYSFTKKGIVVNGMVYDVSTGEPISEASVIMIEEDNIKGKAQSGKEGEFTFPAIPGKKYVFSATKQGYLPAEVVEDVKEKPELIKIPMIGEGGINMEVTVLDKKTREPLENSKIKMTNLTTNKEEVCSANKDGKCNFTLEPNTNYRLEASKETGEPDTKYLTVTATQSTVGKKAPATLYTTLELEKVKKGVAIKIENIYYDLDKWFIRPDISQRTRQAGESTERQPDLRNRVELHTDCRATAKYNQQLSSKEAEAAVNYIVSKELVLGD